MFPAAIKGGNLGHGTFFKTWDAARRPPDGLTSGSTTSGIPAL